MTNSNLGSECSMEEEEEKIDRVSELDGVENDLHGDVSEWRAAGMEENSHGDVFEFGMRVAGIHENSHGDVSGFGLRSLGCRFTCPIP